MLFSISPVINIPSSAFTPLQPDFRFRQILRPTKRHGADKHFQVHIGGRVDRSELTAVWIPHFCFEFVPTKYRLWFYRA